MLERFVDLSTPLLADACVRLGVPLRAAPPGVRPVLAGERVAGRVLPARHYGSVDVFLEAYGHASGGRSGVHVPASPASRRWGDRGVRGMRGRPARLAL